MIAWDNVSTFFPLVTVLTLSVVVAIISTMLSIATIAREKENSTNRASAIASLVLSWGFVGVCVFLGAVCLLISYQDADEHYEKKSQALLDIAIYQEWFTENATKMDKMLTLKEISYLELDIESYVSLSDKEELYFSGIGLNEDTLVMVELTDTKGKRYDAHLTVIENGAKEDGIIELKNTAEFGEEYAFGDPIFYGNLYVD